MDLTQIWSFDGSEYVESKCLVKKSDLEHLELSQTCL
jgi:hypothetical protein